MRNAKMSTRKYRRSGTKCLGEQLLGDVKLVWFECCGQDCDGRVAQVFDPRWSGKPPLIPCEKCGMGLEEAEEAGWTG
jgi:hypothetical protein